MALAWDSAAGPAPGLGAVRRSRAGRRVDRKWGTCVITVSRATLDTRVVGATERRAHERRARQAASDRERRWRSRAPGLGGGWPPTFAVLLVRSTVPRGEVVFAGLQRFYTIRNFFFFAFYNLCFMGFVDINSIFKLLRLYI